MPLVHLCRRALALPLGALLLLAPLPEPASAQSLPIGDLREEYLRVLETIGAARTDGFGIRPFTLSELEGAVGDTINHPLAGWFGSPPTMRLGENTSLALADPRLRVLFNSGQPHGPNEGALWAGRGISSALDFGAAVRWGRATLTLHPTLVYSQNREFELAPVGFEGMPPYAYPWRWIDLPQRFGPDAVVEVDPGQSALDVDVGAVTLSLSTRNLWWGPGLRNAIVLSNNAPGFPHLSAATRRPISVGVGTVQGQWLWGRLQQSDWFDSTFVETGRYITGAVVTFQPDLLEGLSLGVTRIFYALVPDEGIPVSEYFLVFQGVSKGAMASDENPTGDDERSQMASVFGRWVLPMSNTEIWAEWARNDHGWNVRDYFLQPEHSSALTLGLRHVLELSGERLLSLEFERTRLESTRTSVLRASPTYYEHSVVLQGYTQRGQVIGAGLGPGGNSQYAAAKLYRPQGRIGIHLERRVRDNDAYYFDRRDSPDFCCHNIFQDLGLSAAGRVGAVELDATSIVTWETNRHFRELDDHWNVHLRLSARWRHR